MMTEDEIKLRLSLDDKPLDEGTRRALAKIANFGKEAGASFAKPQSEARAFRKLVEQISDISPVAGGALKLAFEPMVGIFAAITFAAVSMYREIEKLNELFDKMGQSNAKALGNIRVAMREAAHGNAEEARAMRREHEELDNPLAQQMAEARTMEERQALLANVEARRIRTQGTVSSYYGSESIAHRESERLKAGKHGQNIEGIQGKLADLEETISATRGTAMKIKEADAGSVMGRMVQSFQGVLTAGGNFQERNIYDAAIEARDYYRKQLQAESDKRQKITDALADELSEHQSQVEELKKLKQAEIDLREKIRTTRRMQAEYDLSLAVAKRDKSEFQSGPYTPGLGELAGYQGPSSAIAREVLAAREMAKRQSGFMTPDERYAANIQVQSAQYDLGNEWRGATTYEGRGKALQKYGQRLQGIISGKTSPEHTLESINDHIKALNEKAGSEGLIVRGAD